MKNLRKITSLFIVLVACVGFVMAEDTYKVTLTRVNTSKKAQTVSALQACGLTPAKAQTAFEQVKKGNQQVIQEKVSQSYAQDCIYRIKNVGGAATMTKNAPATSNSSSGTNFSQATVQNAYTVLLAYSPNSPGNAYASNAIGDALVSCGVPKGIAYNAVTEACKQGKFALITGGASQTEANNYISKVKAAGGLAFMVKNTSSTPLATASKKYTVTLKKKLERYNFQSFKSVCNMFGVTNQNNITYLDNQLTNIYAVDVPVTLSEYNANKLMHELQNQKLVGVVAVSIAN